MTEEEKQAELLNVMEFLELINNLIQATQQAEELPFEKLTPEDWEIFQEGQGIVRYVLEQIKEQLTTHSTKLIDNDALYAHLQTVLLAPDE